MRLLQGCQRDKLTFIFSSVSGESDFMTILRPRVERLLYGDFVLDDLTRIFLFLRGQSYGRQTVREIGDFVAHFGERDRGVTTDLARDFFKLLRFMVPLMNNPVSNLSLNPDILSASFAMIDMEHIRDKTKLKPKIARKVFKSLMQKAKSVVGSNNTVQLTAEESALCRILLSSFTVKPAFDDALLNKEFAECMEKNNLLCVGEDRLVKDKGHLITLFALYNMHQSVLRLDDGSQAYLQLDYHNQNRFLTIRASSPCRTPQLPTLQIARSIFNTSLLAAEWCEQEILFDDDQKHVDFPVEIGPNLKFRRIEPARSVL